MYKLAYIWFRNRQLDPCLYRKTCNSQLSFTRKIYQNIFFSFNGSFQQIMPFEYGNQISRLSKIFSLERTLGWCASSHSIRHARCILKYTIRFVWFVCGFCFCLLMPHLKSSRILILAEGVFIWCTPEQIEHIMVENRFVNCCN